MNKTIENRRDFLTRLLAGTVVITAAAQITKAEKPAMSHEEFKEYVFRETARAKRVYDQSPPDVQRAKIQHLEDEYNSVVGNEYEHDFLRQFFLDFKNLLLGVTK